MVVAEAAFDINEDRGKKVGKLELTVLNIRPRNRLHALAVSSARATKTFFWQLPEKLAQLS